MIISNSRARKSWTADERDVHSRARTRHHSPSIGYTRWVKRNTNRHERREVRREIRLGIA